MNDVNTDVRARGGRMRMARSRGATTGFLLILLGAWGALIPFVGPYFDFSYTPDQVWTWTDARGWFEVLPGAATALGGLLLLISANRATAMLGGWLAVLGGVWFVVGLPVSGLLTAGNPGSPVADTDAKRALLELTYFYGLGAVIAALGGIALGRISVRGVRDVEFVHSGRAVAEPEPVAEPARADYSQTPIAEAPTTVVPTAGHEREHRGWRDRFSRRERRTPVAH
jgi:hypothetical protein